MPKNLCATASLLSLLMIGASPVFAAQVTDYQLVTMSDIHLGAKSPMQLAPSGPLATNDLDLPTFVNLLLPQLNQSVTQIEPQSILVLGDLVDHADGGAAGTPASRALQLTNAFQNLKNTFPTLPINYVFGNNDSLLGDYQQFYDANDTGHSAYEIAKSASWSDGFLSSGNSCSTTNTTYPCIIANSENTTDGYYAEYLQPHLKLVALNSVLFEGEHSSTYHGNNYNGEFAWLTQELDDAVTNHDSVVLAMHVPPATDISSTAAKSFWQPAAYTTFLTIVKAHPNTILAILVGHTHMEELRILESNNKEVIPIIFTAGLSTAHGNVPSFKSFTFGQVNNQWQLKNYTAYQFDATTSRFNALYDFMTAYNCPSTAVTINACLQTKLNQLSAVFATLNNFYTVKNPNYAEIPADQNANDLLDE